MYSSLQQILARPVALTVTSCALAIGGLFAFIQLPLMLVPSLEFPALSIHMSWGGASAESVEQILTRPVEEIVSSLRGVRSVRSTSQEGRSRVNAEFDVHSDMNFARLELNERLALFARQLPRGASHPAVERYVPEDLEQLQGFLRYSLAGLLPRSTLVRIAEEKIIPGLMQIKGVVRVTLRGREEQELRVEVAPERLSAAGITVADVITALEAAYPERCRGSVRGPAGVEGISVADSMVSGGDLENMPVRRTGGLVRLRDLGSVATVPTAPRELLRINGKECLTLTITRDPTSNLPGAARSVHSYVAGCSQDLPPSVELICEMDQSRRMNDEFNLLFRDGMFSLILLWGILSLFLGSNRAPLVLLVSVLLSIAGTLLVLWMLRIPLHLLTLTGLVLGIGRLLDDSIVVLENLRRWMESERLAGSVLKGTQEVMMPVVASTLATAGAMVPVFFLPRNMQLYVQEFAISAAVALFVSLLVSFTVIPSAALRWKLEGGRMMVPPGGALSSLYRWLLGRALRHRVAVLIVTLWIFGIPVWLLPVRMESSSVPAILYNETIGGRWFASVRPMINTVLGGVSYQFFRNVPHTDFLDPGGGTYLVMQVDFPQGTDMASEDVVARSLEHDLLRAGAPRLTTHVLPGMLVIRIDFPDSTIASTLPQALRSRCFRLAAQVGGAAVSVAGFGVGLSGGVDLQPAFALRVLGYDYKRVKHIAESLRGRLLRNPRVVAADIDKSLGNWSRMQELALNIDRDATARYGLTKLEIADALRNHTSANPRNMTVNLQGVRLPCVVTGKDFDRFSVADLASAAVSGKRPSSVPLRSLLTVQQRTAPSEIVREDQQYVRWVSFEYRGPYRHAQAFLDATISAFPLPEGYRFERTDNSTVSDNDRNVLLLTALAALLVVFMVTASLYESMLDPCIVLLSVPFAYIGVFVAFILAGAPFGKGGYLAAILLTGIAVANAIVIVDFIGKRVKEKGKDAVTIIEASVCRLRPVLMTTLTTAGSLLPMLLDERGSIWYSLALGTFGGILTSATLTLVVIPVIYAVAHRVNETQPVNNPPPHPQKRGPGG